MNAALGLTAGLGLDGDRCIHVIPRHHGSKYQFNRCPFGLSQAPAYFQRLVHEVLRGLPFTFGYLDDILIY